MALEKNATLDDYYAFIDRPENAGTHYELINGEIVAVSPSFTPSAVAARIIYYLTAYVMKHRSGYITGADGGYVMPDGNKFNPYVGYITKARLPQKPEREAPVPPDFAVEVISPTDDATRIAKKREVYLRAKIPLLWYADPDAETVTVYAHGEERGTFNDDDLLDGGDVLPGFRVTVRDLFDID